MSWLFRDLVNNAPKKGKALDLLGAIENVNRLHKEAVWLLRTWAIYETSNGYPISSSAEKLYALINSNGEGHGIKVVRELAIRDSVMTVLRILDVDSAGRNTLSNTGIFLRRVVKSQVLSKLPAANELKLPHRNFDWVYMDQITTRLTKRLSEQDGSLKSLAYHRKKLKGFRDYVLAHSMPNELYDKPNFFNMKDAVVFISVCVVDALMLINGTNWDAKSCWKREVADAKQFWTRYQEGFSS